MITSKKQPKTTIEIFDLIKEKYGLKTNGELSDKIGLTERYIYKLKRDEKKLTEDKAIELAQKAGVSPEYMLILLAREKALSDDLKAHWNNIMEMINVA